MISVDAKEAYRRWTLAVESGDVFARCVLRAELKDKSVDELESGVVGVEMPKEEAAKTLQELTGEWLADAQGVLGFTKMVKAWMLIRRRPCDGIAWLRSKGIHMPKMVFVGVTLTAMEWMLKKLRPYDGFAWLIV